MTITGGSALPKDDIEQMIKDAEAHAEEDRRRREAAETRNQADTLVYQTDKTLQEHGDKVDASVKAEIEQAVSDLRETLDGDDTDAIRSKMDTLMEKSQQLAQAIYSQPSEGEPAADAADASTDGGEDEVVDAEIIDEGDDDQQAAG